MEKVSDIDSKCPIESFKKFNKKRGRLHLYYMALLFSAAALTTYLLSDASGPVWKVINPSLPQHLRGHFPKLLTGTPTPKLPILGGHVFLVTGATHRNSLGYHVAYQLAVQKARVFITGVNIRRGERVAKELRERIFEVYKWRAQIIFVELNLSHFSSVFQLKKSLEAHSVSRLEGVICCEEVKTSVFRETELGNEMMFGTNFIGHYLLVKELEPLLKKSVEVLNKCSTVTFLSSNSHYKLKDGIRGLEFFRASGRKNNVDISEDEVENGMKYFFKDLNNRDMFDEEVSFNEVKLAITMIAKELGDKYAEGVEDDEPQIVVNSVHPGFVPNERGEFDSIEIMGKKITPMEAMKIGWTFEDAALGIAHVATSDKIRDLKTTGQYFHPIGVFQDPSKYAKNKRCRRALYLITEKYIELNKDL
eukprot:snap_masked-scaffold_22-processed-gene-5.39-mRNA-1 protein AED:1.00 eAED:1.00 QI:0/-1/0/0/-1/1/1/0/419